MLWEAFIALVAGVLSFFSPCVLPIFPGYVSFITGTGLEQLLKENEKAASRKVIFSSVFFITGFSLVFILLGASASFIGIFLRSKMWILTKIAGIGILVFGLHMIGIFKIPFLYREKRIQQHYQKSPGAIKSFLAGIFFSFGWTPCIGPVLAAILAWAAVAENFYKGIALLIFYATGLAVPFFLSALFLNVFIKYLRPLSRHLHKIEIALGIILIGLGILILFNRLDLLSSPAGGISLDRYIPESWAKRLSSENRSNSSEIDSKFDFALPDMQGNIKSLKDLGSTITIVNFWATWCPPCQEEMPGLSQLHNKYKDKGLNVIGIAERSDTETAKKFIQAKNINYEILFDKGEKVANKYGVFGLPATYIFNAQRKKIKTFDGYTEPKEIEALIASYLK